SATETEHPDPSFSESTPLVHSGGSSDLVLYYLKHGSLPSRACELSLRALRHIAGQITDDQLRSIANSLASSAQVKEFVQRPAPFLAPQAFARFKSTASSKAPILERTAATLPPAHSGRKQPESAGSSDFACKAAAGHKPSDVRTQDSATGPGKGGANTS